jgi:hypothetical protein
VGQGFGACLDGLDGQAALVALVADQVRVERGEQGVGQEAGVGRRPDLGQEPGQVRVVEPVGSPEPDLR